jgi:chemotaxis protein methyltransferase CheR
VNVPGATLYQKNGHGLTATNHYPALTPPAPWPPVPGLQQPWSPPVLPAIPDSARSGQDQWPPTPLPTGLAQVRQLADEGNFLDAARACAQLLDHDRLNPVVHFYQALIMEQMRDHPDAEQAFRRAIYLDRAFVLAHYHLALLLARTGRRDSAAQSLRNVQRLLSGMDSNQQIADADGLTVNDLGQLADMHLGLWQK